MTLLYPWVLLGFPLYLLCERFCRQRIQEIYFPNVPMLKKATKKGRDLTRILRYALLFLMLLALSAPVQEKRLTQDHGIGYDISLLLDASDSMREAQRFETAKTILSDFIQSRQGDRLALSLFADYAYLSVPLTYHKEALTTVLQHMRIGVAGTRHTALYEALYLGVRLFENSTAKQKIVILLTDGLNTVKSVPLEVALAEAKKQQLKVYTIGIGDDYRRKILQRIAEETGGKFYQATDPQALQAIYHEINQLEKSTFATDTVTYHIPLFRYPLLLALLLMLPFLFLAYRQRTLSLAHYATLFFLLVALYGPHTTGEALGAHQPDKSLLLVLDLSRSMSCEDTFPSRLQIMYNRVAKLIDAFPSTKIGLTGFAAQGYLIAAPTLDHHALKQLLRQLDLKHISREGSNILAALQNADMLLPTQGSRTVVLFSDGGQMQDFSEEITYAKAQRLQVSVYAIGTAMGGVIKADNTLRKDKAGNIIITRINPRIKILATETGGIYLQHTASDATLAQLVQSLLSGTDPTDNTSETFREQREPYALPLLLALLLLGATHLGFRRSK